MYLNYVQHQKFVFKRDFEFIMSHYDEIHEYRLRTTISPYLDYQISLNNILPWEKHEYLEYYLQLIEETPMILFSKNMLYPMERNKILIPDSYMLKFDEWCTDV